MTEASPPKASIHWMKDHREMYLRSGGAQGHIMDLSHLGGHRMTEHCLIRTIGAKTGRTYINALCYGAYGGEIVVVASKGGAPKSPGWYHNIRAAGAVDVQIATQAFRATWREPEGAERDAVWAHMVTVLPNYDHYQQITERRIPVVMFKIGEELPVFRIEDAG